MTEVSKMDENQKYLLKSLCSLTEEGCEQFAFMCYHLVVVEKEAARLIYSIRARCGPNFEEARTSFCMMVHELYGFKLTDTDKACLHYYYLKLIKDTKVLNATYRGNNKITENELEQAYLSIKKRMVEHFEFANSTLSQCNINVGDW